MNSLDRPVWESLAHAPHLAEGSDLAKRFRRDVNVFASAYDDSPPSLAALDKLVGHNEAVFLLQVPAICVPEGLVAVREAEGVQLIAVQSIEPETGEETIMELGDADAADMLALASLTEPGPFLQRTHTMGRFIGIRINGQLAAMAGERNLVIADCCFGNRPNPSLRAHSVRYRTEVSSSAEYRCRFGSAVPFPVLLARLTPALPSHLQRSFHATI
jgi:hypothetical protein